MSRESYYRQHFHVDTLKLTSTGLLGQCLFELELLVLQERSPDKKE